MWNQYKKTFFLTQSLIVAVCAGAYCVDLGKIRLILVCGIFLLMQASAFIWAWVGARLSRKLKKHQDKLPIKDQ